MPTVGHFGSADTSPGGFVQRLSHEDLSILDMENETVAGHTCKVIMLRNRIDPDALRVSIASRLGQAPKLSMRLCEIDGEPCWAPDPQVDLSEHVVVRDPPEPPDQAGLRVAVARIFEQRLDRSRPLWRIDVIPELAGGGSALLWRIHHALADGATTIRIASAALWDADLASDARVGRPPESPRASTDATATSRHRIEGVLTAVRVAPRPWLRSPFNGHIGARRDVAFATVDLEALHRVAANQGATVNDAVLTAVAGGLRRWLEARHGHIGSVRVKVPVSLHDCSVTPGHESHEPGNRDSFFCLDLPLGSADPFARMAAIRRATRVRKDGHDAQHLDALMGQLARTPQLRHFAEQVLAHPRSFALNVSNVPGPRGPVHILGIPVRALYSIAEIREHHALRVAVTSLAGTLNFGLTADPTLLADIDHLAGHIQAEAATLVSVREPG